MIIKPNSTTVVYMNTQQYYYKSVYSRFEIMIPEYKMVGYIEDLGVLCYGHEVVYYDMKKYFNDVMVSDIQEMTYQEYIQYYQGKLTKENPDAPTISSYGNNIQFGSTTPAAVNEYGQQNITQQVLNSNNPALADLNRHGIKVQILKG